MDKNTAFLKAVLVTLGLLVLGALVACTGSSNPTTTTTTVPTVTTSTPVVGGPGGGAIINSDSTITGVIKSITKQSTGYPWTVDVLIMTSQDVGTLPNPTKDEVGQVVTLKTDQDLTKFIIGQSITAKVKFVGDVPLPGITQYIYNIAASSSY